MTTYEQVRQAWDELSQQRRVLMDAEREQLKARVDEAMIPDEREFSLLLHQSREAGMSMVELRQASRQYGNPAFKRIWDLVEGPTKVAREANDDRYEWVGETTLRVFVGDTEVMVHEVQWFDEPEAGRRTPMFNLDDQHLNLYAPVYRQVELALLALDNGED